MNLQSKCASWPLEFRDQLETIASNGRIIFLGARFDKKFLLRDSIYYAVRFFVFIRCR
jgi:hypothetical protein